MQDFLGNDLNIGDEVVFVELNYRCLRIAKIVAFTPKKVRLEHTIGKSVDRVLQEPNQLVKVIKNVY